MRPVDYLQMRMYICRFNLYEEWPLLQLELSYFHVEGINLAVFSSGAVTWSGHSFTLFGR